MGMLWQQCRVQRRNLGAFGNLRGGTCVARSVPANGLVAALGSMRTSLTQRFIVRLLATPTSMLGREVVNLLVEEARHSSLRMVTACW